MLFILCGVPGHWRPAWHGLVFILVNNAGCGQAGIQTLVACLALLLDGYTVLVRTEGTKNIFLKEEVTLS